jgi:pyridoxamine 5'-phosphate oxidase
MDDPNAMLVSSVDADGRPSARTVLLKSFDDQGFVFYTNYESRKGRQILANPNVSLHFFWRELERQVGIEGVAERVTDEEADAYFATRPRGSQLGAWASRQSRPMPSRATLLAEVAKVEARYLGRSVPRPPHWSGFRVVPRRFEFWVAGRFRLHDRTVFEREDGGWRSQKLYP